MKVMISRSQVTDGQSTLHILNTLAKHNIRGSSIESYVMQQVGWKIRQFNSNSSPQTIRITIGGIEYATFDTILIVVCAFGSIGTQLAQRTDQTINVHSTGMDTLRTLVDQFIKRNAVKLQILGFDNLIGIDISGGDMEIVHLHSLIVALLCFALSPVDILNEAVKRGEDEVYLVAA